ncbi:penicillin-binding protein 1A [Benzoatithermus flavus]|uniref:Penicillin-binding protein 1A n=1 Tax=Benzoatithermus flavus TaxID=3108223 RepID=A0ABU8XL52_9PROT
MRRLFRFLASLVLGTIVLAVLAGIGLFVLVERYGGELPDYRQLATYEPPTTTRIHAGDGRLLAEYAREKRVYVPAEAIPDRVKQAFIAAEDQNFYRHPGIDIVGISRALLSNVQRLGTDRRPEGASTITQQVAKNFLLSNELSYKRKLKEAILALRMERAFTKDHILELYLNEIFLGNRSYGVAAAALNYFNKSLDELSIAEAALLGGLPKAPSSYDPRRNPEAALARRNYVIGRMADDGYITAAEAEAARNEPIVLREQSPTEFAEADFFIEEVRRQLVARLGEDGFYAGGLSVRVTVSPKLQEIADRALRHGLSAYDRRRGWRGPWGRIDLAAAGAAWPAKLASMDPGFELGTWKRGVVLEAQKDRVEVGLEGGEKIRLSASDVAWTKRNLDPGDLVLLEPMSEGGERRWVLRQRPEVDGAVVAIDPHTGRVLAMSGGFSYRQSKFNRATQAKRQPGSAFKPFVYLAALEEGMTPATVMLDAPIVVDQGPGLPKWRPENYTDDFLGPITLRVALEKSRNTISVRIAQTIGMAKIIDLANRVGIGEGLGPYLAASLGANEVTPLQLTAAYASIVNGGKKIEPVLVERIQDRHGRTIMRGDPRSCDGCNGIAWDGSPPPALPDPREQVLDPRHAYQMVSMLEGVVERGTAKAALSIGKPVAGKTGTSNDSRDTWFVGFSPDLVVGVFVGYDQPQSLGKHETGASVALPIWIEVMDAALKDQPATPFRTPPGLTLVRVDATTGRLPGPDSRAVITEAFLPGTEPGRDRSIDPDAEPADPFTAARETMKVIPPGTSGLY